MAAAMFFLVIAVSRGAVVMPEKYTWDQCRAAAATINRSASEGGVTSGWGYCVPAPTKP